MGFTNTEQLRELFLCAGVGFLLGAYYDVFRLLRLLLPSLVVAVFFEDVFFFVTGAAAVFLFSLTVTDGALRVYVFMGLAAGFAAYRSTVGRVVVRQTARFLRWVRRLFRRMGGGMRKFFTACRSHVKISRKKPEKI